ncbi:MAG: hypothetical protein HZC42_03570 [Candidatus Eisenbacteria bacterium]|nr:hypothetical protein [Candidatus Eisenbacteria bacterium]
MRSIRQLVLPVALLWLVPQSALATWSHNPYTGNLAVSATTYDQSSCLAVSDGAGGMIVAWQDTRSGTSTDIYAQRVSAAGVPLWTANGVAVCTAANEQFRLTIAADEWGGAFLAWVDYRSGAMRVYAQELNSAGTALWTSGGLQVCTAAADQNTPSIASDLSGGALVTWVDYRNVATAPDIYVQRIYPGGGLLWGSNGTAICTAASTQAEPQVVGDGGGGGLIVWGDYRGLVPEQARFHLRS